MSVMRHVRRSLFFVGVGAAVSYLCDPEQGPARRARIEAAFRDWRRSQESSEVPLQGSAEEPRFAPDLTAAAEADPAPADLTAAKVDDDRGSAIAF